MCLKTDQICDEQSYHEQSCLLPSTPCDTTMPSKTYIGAAALAELQKNSSFTCAPFCILTLTVAISASSAFNFPTMLEGSCCSNHSVKRFSSASPSASSGTTIFAATEKVKAYYHMLYNVLFQQVVIGFGFFGSRNYCLQLAQLGII